MSNQQALGIICQNQMVLTNYPNQHHKVHFRVNLDNVNISLSVVESIIGIMIIL
jgi:hypothetical protein